MLKKSLVILLSLCLMAAGFTLLTTTAFADDGNGSELILLFEENFEEYEKDVNVSSTLMPDFFVADYNSIGDGVIHVQEATNGNLYLKSHVFTQIYSSTPIVGAYEFSLDVLEAQGRAQTGILIRAPKTQSAYYEADGHPDTSTCHGGLFLYPRGSALGVNVKTYDEKASGTAFLQNNTVEFPLPEGAAYPYNIRAVDTGAEITLYVNDTLICRITYSDPGKVYGSHQSEGKFYGSAKLFDAEGNEKGSYTNPLLSSDGSYIGWTTRAADMSVDNVKVLVNQSYRAVLAIGKLPSSVTSKNVETVKELADEARALYDALTDEEKSLVLNYGKLEKAEESIAKLEATTTEAPTEPATEPVTEPVTEPAAPADTEATTAAPSPDTNGTVTDAPTATETLPTETSPEVKVMDDSLAIWILLSVMIVAVCGTAAYITVKVRK